MKEQEKQAIDQQAEAGELTPEQATLVSRFLEQNFGNGGELSEQELESTAGGSGREYISSQQVLIQSGKQMVEQLLEREAQKNNVINPPIF